MSDTITPRLRIKAQPEVSVRARAVPVPKVRLRVMPSLLPLQIELRNTGSMVQWRYVGGDWQDLIPVSDLDTTITIGTVTTLPPGADATVVNVGTPQDVVLNFGIPAGFDGEDGLLASVVAGLGISVNSADPANPVVSAAVQSVAGLTGAIAAAALKTALAIAVADITDASANGRSLISAANYAAMRTLLSLVPGTDFYSKTAADAAFQAIDPQLSSLIRQNSQSAAYTLVLTDGGKHIYHPPADTTARIWTIPANASVAFPIGTVVTFDNDFGAGAITIAITTDTLVLVGAAGSTGSRTLASGGQATAIKVTSTRWRISGVGLT